MQPVQKRKAGCAPLLFSQAFNPRKAATKTRQGAVRSPPPGIRKPDAQPSSRVHRSNIPKVRYMPTPKTPLSKAKLTGADKRNPQRFRDRTEPRTSGEPVGNPPEYLGKEAKAVWGELSASLGWLIREDRAAVELASVALGQVREFVKAGEPVPASLMAASNTALGKLGATPADRAKVAMPADDDDEHDPWAQFQPEGRA